MDRDANGLAGARAFARASGPARRPVSFGVAAIAAGLLAFGLAGDATARDQDPCAGGAARIGDLGIASIDCDCTLDYRVRSKDGKSERVARWIFRSEPRVEEVRPDGPAAGKLREGDVITAIDGVLITTREGARRFVEAAPGVAVTLTVRRGGRETPVRIVAGAICPEDALWPTPAPPVPPVPAVPATPAVPPTPAVPATPPVPPTPPLRWVATPMIAPTPEVEPMEHETPDPPGRATRAPRARRPMRAISTQDALPSGWSGFGLTCSECGGEANEEGPPVWKFGTLPIIYFIDPESPAARAGFQVGDVLTHIDGVSLLDAEGGRRFGALKPGQTVRWKYRRGPKSLSATVVTERRGGERTVPLWELQDRLKALGESEELDRLSADMARTYEEMTKRGLITPAPRAQSKRLRYAGAVGGSEVEVRGLGTVIVDDSGDEIVITTRDATIRIRPAALPAAAPQKRKPE